MLTSISLAIGAALSIAGVVALLGGNRIGVLFLIFGLPLLTAGVVRLWLALKLRRLATQPESH